MLTFALISVCFSPVRMPVLVNNYNIKPYSVMVFDPFQAEVFTGVPLPMNDLLTPLIAFSHVLNFAAFYMLFDILIIPFYKAFGLLPYTQDDKERHARYHAKKDKILTPFTAERYPPKDEIEPGHYYYIGDSEHCKQYLFVVDDDNIDYDMCEYSKEFSELYDMDIMICKVVSY